MRSLQETERIPSIMVTDFVSVPCVVAVRQGTPSPQVKRGASTPPFPSPHPPQPKPTSLPPLGLLLLPREATDAEGRRMCEGRRPGHATRPPWALAELERARARAAELQRRLEENYGKRRRLKRVVAATRSRIHDTRALLQDHQDPHPPPQQQQLPAESDPTS
ncbi:hypothetical protein CFC21_079919 [Triticum aestivum]|uniref:Uncharacterized protein n=2 Tax=Triticum aestivum TaxID=4565 RepID=A0A9R1I174_WHEAT|nr:hypothetical protein CFC21_079919 [Triticum aestivum]